jgi:glutamate-1-semialdehyde 2,1-aminomutase
MGMEEILSRQGIPAKTVGEGSIFNLVMTANHVSNIQDVLRSEMAIRKQLDFSLLDQGIYVKPLNRFSLSTAHTDPIIDETLERFEVAAKKTFK